MASVPLFKKRNGFAPRNSSTRCAARSTSPAICQTAEVT